MNKIKIKSNQAPCLAAHAQGRWRCGLGSASGFSSRSDGLSRAVALQARQGCDFDLIQSCERKAEKALLVGLSHTPAHFEPPRVRTNEISNPLQSVG